MNTLTLVFSDESSPRLLETRFKHDASVEHEYVPGFNAVEWNSAASALGRLLCGTALVGEDNPFNYVMSLPVSQLGGYNLEIYIGDRQISCRELKESSPVFN